MVAAREQKWKRVGFEFDFFLPAFLNERFKMAVPTVEIVDVHELVMSLRMIKDEHEIELIRKAAEIGDEGIRAALEFLKEGVTENEVAAEAEYAMRKKGAEGTAFPTFVNSGPRSLWLHGLVTHRKIKKGDLVVIDLGPVYHGYTANICRTVAVGPVSSEKRRLHECYLKMQETVIKAVKPGIKVLELENLASEIVRAGGYGEYYVRGIGHGVGLTFEETPMPTIFPQDTLVELRPNMVFTVGHPVLSVPKVGGVRIEDTLLVTSEGNVSLTRYPKRLIEK
jgi:Xaa-Pro aminopeptidase